MAEQNYDNHRKYYTPHHFIFYPAIITLIVISIRYASRYPDKEIEFYLIAAAFLMIGLLSFMMRQHYALGNQNRIVRLEMRLRYFQLTGKPFDVIEKQLSFGQIAALRFASDEQLPVLIQHTIDNNLLPGNIKKAVQNWQPDHMRV